MSSRTDNPKGEPSDTEQMLLCSYGDLKDFFEHDSRKLYHLHDVKSLWRYLVSQPETGLMIYHENEPVTLEDLALLPYKELTISQGSLLTFCAVLRRNPSKGRALSDNQRALLMDWAEA